MQFVRKLLLVLITPLLPLLLFALAFDIGVLRVAGSPEPVKKILADSGVYNSVIPSALDQAQKASSGGSEVSLTGPAVKSAAQASFTPAVVQQSTEKAIDGIYNWLNGKTPKPDFNIDLSGTKANFANGVAQAAQAKAASLPACPAGRPPTSVDVFSATCLPRGFSPTQAANQAKNDVLSGQGFLEHPVITADSVKGSNPNQSIFEGQFKNAPKQFQRVKKTPVILAVLAVLAIGGIIFLSPSRRQGLRHVGVTLAAIGLFMLAFAWVLNWGAANKLTPNIKLDNVVLQSNVRKVVTDVAQKIDQNYWTFGVAYAVVGALAIAGAMYLGPRGKQPAVALEKPEPVAANPPPNPVPVAPKPPRKSVKIQVL